jgi:plastocyanin
MKRKRKTRIRVVVAALAVAGIFTASAMAHVPQGTLTISHQMRGCHTWSFNNGPSKASLKIKIAPGTTLKVIDNDVMPHRLLQVGGPKAKLISPAMRHMSAQAKVVFAKKGTYRFTTKAGEDYPAMAHMKTVGEDYVLRLTVVVS